MSVEHNSEQDLNKIYNKAVENLSEKECEDFLLLYENLVIEISSWRRWRETALQISKNLGEANADSERLANEYIKTLNEIGGVYWENAEEKSPALIMHRQRLERK